MGLFSKFKNSMDGGVELRVQAPSSVPSNQVIPVTVSVSSNSSQTINSVKAEITAQAREQGLGIGNGQSIGLQESRTMPQAVAQTESRESFTVVPGETKTVNLQLYLNGGATGVGGLGQLGNVGGVLGGVLQGVATVAQGFGHINYTYEVKASAEVQGAHMSPSDKQPIQILPPAEAAGPTVNSAVAPTTTAPVPTQPPPNNPSPPQPGPQL